MKNYYKTIYPSGDLKAIANYLDSIQRSLTFSGYNCYWIRESEQDGTKEKIPCTPDLGGRIGESLYVETRLGRNVMDVYVSKSSSDQLVVECFYCAFTRFLIAFPPLMFLFIGLCFGEDILSVLKVVLVIFAVLKILLHLFFMMDKNKFMKHLKAYLKEEPVQSVSSWKLKI